MKQVTVVSEPAPGRVNEDYAATGQHWAVVLDGATAPANVDSGCEHDVAWLVRNLAAELAAGLVRDPAVPLADCLATAIAATVDAHRDTCDLGNPDSPSATVTILRERGDGFDYLALADSPLVLATDRGPRVVVDDRTAHLTDYSVAGVRAARNSRGGFWVASTEPAAAFEAVTGSVPAGGVHAAALLTDGASRLVDHFGVLDWAGLLAELAAHGPRALVERTRQVERTRPGPADGRSHKRHDDATIVHLTY